MPPGVTRAKYNDLMSLCTSKAIHEDYHGFYSSLLVNVGLVEMVPEPGVEGVEDELRNEYGNKIFFLVTQCCFQKELRQSIQITTNLFMTVKL